MKRRPLAGFAIAVALKVALDRLTRTLCALPAPATAPLRRRRLAPIARRSASPRRRAPCWR
jgi:hypothetical protein